MKNFYHILQIKATASKQEIKAAYKHLARQYHPDRLTAENREDQSQLEKIQEINEAYHTLSDDEKRKNYDQALKEYDEKVASDASPFEKRSLLVKCAKTKSTYKMSLVREKNTNAKFEIVGFEPAEKPLLSASGSNWIAKAAETILNMPGEISLKPQNGLKLFNKKKPDLESAIGIQDIHWSKTCPDCKTEVETDGFFHRWFVCRWCKHLFCPSNIVTTFIKRKITWCPWCGRENLILFKQTQKKWGILGEEFRDSKHKGKKLLSGNTPKALGDGKKTKK